MCLAMLKGDCARDPKAAWWDGGACTAAMNPAPLADVMSECMVLTLAEMVLESLPDSSPACSSCVPFRPIRVPAPCTVIPLPQSCGSLSGS